MCCEFKADINIRIERINMSEVVESDKLKQIISKIEHIEEAGQLHESRA